MIGSLLTWLYTFNRDVFHAWLLKLGPLFFSIIGTTVSLFLFMRSMITRLLDRADQFLSSTNVPWQSGDSSGFGAASQLFGIANTFFPVVEVFALMSFMVSVLIVTSIVRIIKSFIPTIA